MSWPAELPTHAYLLDCRTYSVQNGSAADIVGSTFNNNKAGVTGGALRVEVRACRCAALCKGSLSTQEQYATCLVSDLLCTSWNCIFKVPRCQHAIATACLPTPACCVCHATLPPQGNLMCTGCIFLENKAPVGGAVNLGPNSWAGFQQYTFQLNTGVRAGSEPCCGWTWGVNGTGYEGLAAHAMRCVMLGS